MDAGRLLIATASAGGGASEGRLKGVNGIDTVPRLYPPCDGKEPEEARNCFVTTRPAVAPKGRAIQLAPPGEPRRVGGADWATLAADARHLTHPLVAGDRPAPLGSCGGRHEHGRGRR